MNSYLEPVGVHGRIKQQLMRATRYGPVCSFGKIDRAKTNIKGTNRAPNMTGTIL